MKLLAALIITASLVLGMIASVTAYVPTLDSIDPKDELTLNAVAGLNPDNPAQPRVRPGGPGEETVLTAELIEQLKADGEDRVRVKEFAWSRWTHRWWFVLSAVGLLIGGGLIRFARQRELSRATAGPQDAVDPVAILQDAKSRLESLRSEIDQAADIDRQLELVITRLNEIQEACFEPFVSARPQLLNSFGMAGFAQLMDQFAAAERQLNRAWSAAADGVSEESFDCLDQGTAMLDGAIARLKA